MENQGGEEKSFARMTKGFRSINPIESLFATMEF